jgi:hypothetical protein
MTYKCNQQHLLEIISLPLCERAITPGKLRRNTVVPLSVLFVNTPIIKTHSATRQSKIEKKNLALENAPVTNTILLCNKHKLSRSTGDRSAAAADEERKSAAVKAIPQRVGVDVDTGHLPAFSPNFEGGCSLAAEISNSSCLKWQQSKRTYLLSAGKNNFATRPSPALPPLMENLKKMKSHHQQPCEQTKRNDSDGALEE